MDPRTPATAASRARLLAAIASLALLACDSEPPPEPDDPGAALFRSQGCVTCHGRAGEGSVMGPPLRGLATNWKREDLARYLADPEAFTAKDPRLAGIASKFAMRMPRIAATQEQRLQLADHVLAFD